MVRATRVVSYASSPAVTNRPSGGARRHTRTSRQGVDMERFDVVVLGTGAAGLTAAIAAHEGGASVAVFEKADQVGGTTAWSGGQVWIPNNPHMPEVGVEDSREKALTYIMSLSRDMLEPRAGRGLRRRRAARWSSCSRPRRRCSSTPWPACPTTTRSSRAAARRRPHARVPDLPVRRARRVGRPRHAVAVLRRSAHHDERDARSGKAVPEPPSAEEHARRKLHNERGCGQALAGRLLRACLDRGIEPRTVLRRPRAAHRGRRRRRRRRRHARRPDRGRRRRRASCWPRAASSGTRSCGGPSCGAR